MSTPDFILSLVQGEEGSNWAKGLAGWDEDTYVCQWDGITCDAHNAVTEINLEGRELIATIPEALSKVTSLKYLFLAENQLSGTIPHSFEYSFPNLVQVDLSYNKLRGSVPNMIGKVESINFSNNNFSGRLPSNFGNQLKQLRVLDIKNNRIGGTLPASLGLMDNIVEVDLSDNNFFGLIPDELGSLLHLEGIFLSDNKLSGTLPLSLTREYLSLKEIFLDGNDLSGTLPVALADLPDLVTLFVDNNKLTGTVPDELCTMKLNEAFFGNNLDSSQEDHSENDYNGSKGDSREESNDIQINKEDILFGDRDYPDKSIVAEDDIFEKYEYEDGKNGEGAWEAGGETWIDEETYDDIGGKEKYQDGKSVDDIGDMDDPVVKFDVKGEEDDFFIDTEYLLDDEGDDPIVKFDSTGEEDDYFVGKEDLLDGVGNNRKIMSVEHSRKKTLLTNPSSTRDGCRSISCPAGTQSWGKDGVFPCSPCNHNFFNPYLGAHGCHVLDEQMILKRFYFLAGGENWKDGGETWGDDTIPLCEKRGLSCSHGGKITAIRLPNMNLAGTIFEDLGFLRDLQVLDLSDNSIYGKIPSDLRFPDLEVLNISGNMITGFVPPTLCEKMGINKNGKHGDLNCNNIACPFGTYSETGKSEVDGAICMPCPRNEFLGSKRCIQSINEVVSDSSQNNSGVFFVLLAIIAAAAFLVSWCRNCDKKHKIRNGSTEQDHVYASTYDDYAYADAVTSSTGSPEVKPKKKQDVWLDVPKIT